MNTKLILKEGKVNFKCLGNHCKNSCCHLNGYVKGAVPVFTPDFDEIYLTEHDEDRLLDHALSYMITEHENGLKKMVLDDKLTCIAFEEGRCLINDIKPTMCKAFPFYIDMFGGLAFAGSNCEGISDNTDAGSTNIIDLRDDIDACIEMYSFWIDKIKSYV